MFIVNLAARNSTLIDNSRIARAIVPRSQQRLLQTKKQTKQNTTKKEKTNKQNKKKKKTSEKATRRRPLTSTGTNETGQYHTEAKMEP